jgi:hypothetical protein
MSDIGAFTEKSEITITHRTSDDLRKAIEDKIHRMLGSDVIDVKPVSITAELGLLETTDANQSAGSSEAEVITSSFTEPS